MQRFRAPLLIGLLLGSLSLVSAIVAGLLQYDRQRNVYDAQFERLADNIESLIQDRFQLYEYGLRGARGAVLTALPRLISRNQFERYARSRDLPREFPGSRGIGYIHRVPIEQTDSFIAAARADGFPDFALRELTHHDGEHFIITYIYPLAENDGATGLDIASETSRRQAAVAAARTGLPALTLPITLVQATGQANAGFLILLPVYRVDAALDTPQQREDATVGWTYAPLVTGEVLGGAQGSDLEFSLFDLGSAMAFYKTPGFDPEKRPAFAPHKVTTVPLFGRQWQVTYHANATFLQRHAILSPILVAALVAGIGLLLTALASAYAAHRDQKYFRMREQELLAYRIVEAAPQALLVTDQAGTILQANLSAERLFGWPVHHLTGRSVYELLPEAVRPTHAGLNDSPDYNIRGMGNREIRALRADGTTIPVLVRLSPMPVENRKLIIAGITDISAEIRAIDVLRNSERHWQQLANSLPQLVWTCDADGACDFLSQQWIAYTGIAAETQLGSGWLEQVHPEDRARLMAAWQQAVKTATSFVIEFRVRRHDGVYRLFYTRAEPLRDAEGHITRWIGSNTDIEDRHQAERKIHVLLEEMEERVTQRTAELDQAMHDLRNILDAIPSMIAYWDNNQINRFANHAYERWFGVTSDWLVGRSMRDLLGDTLYEKSRVYIEAALQGQPQQFERDLVDVNGKKHATQTHYLPDIQDGVVKGFYALGFDITELKMAAEAQKAAREAAEEATRAKSIFLTSMSHELRTPMNSILGFSDLMLGQHFGPLNEKQLQYMTILRRSGEHLIKLMDEVLELSKIDSGRLTVSIEPVNAVATVKSAVATLQPLADRHKVTLEAKSIAPEDLNVSADRTRLAQVLINLGSNGIKYNRPGGWVRFTTEQTGSTLRILVSDNGRGIPKERQAGAFQPFNRMGAEQGVVEGTGIGLTLVKSLVEMMGGTVGFESTEGTGSTFWIDLQVSLAAGKDESHMSLNDIPQLSQGGEIPMKILYIEDNENNRILFRHYMGVVQNVDLMEAPDGAEGLKLARAQKPDLIFLDVNLPGMSGFDVLREIRNSPDLKSTAVVALTANAMQGDSERGLSMGFDAYLAKPVRLDQIMQTIFNFRERLQNPSGQ